MLEALRFDLVHVVQNLGRFVARLVANPPEKEQEIINLCCNEQLQLSEFLERFNHVCGRPKRPRMAPDKNPWLGL